MEGSIDTGMAIHVMEAMVILDMEAMVEAGDRTETDHLNELKVLAVGSARRCIYKRMRITLHSS